MRTVIEFTVSAAEDRSSEDILKALADYGWTAPDLGLVSKDFVACAEDIINVTGHAGRDLPVSPESQFIQDVIDARFPAPQSTGRSKTTRRTKPAFERFTFERLCLEQSLLILTQIPELERGESLARDIRCIVGPEFGVYGLLFYREHQQQYIARLRCNDLERLQKASVSFLSAVNPGKAPTTDRRFTSRAVSISRRGPGRLPFESSVTRLEIRSVANEPLFTGTAIPVRSRFTLLRHTLANRSAMVLLSLSVILLAISALLFWQAPDRGWWTFTEQLVGRLATGAFGALLVDGAIDYDALRKSLLGSAGAVSHGALIDWKRA